MYDAFARFYERWHDTEDYEAIADFVVQNAQLQPGDLVFEGGCGAGHLTAALAARGIEVTGLDRSKEMLQFARRRTHGLPVRLLHGDLRALRASEGYKAWVFCLDVFHYLTDPKKLDRLLKNVYKALPVGGTLIFDLLSPEYLIERSQNGAILYDEADYFMAWETSWDQQTEIRYDLHLFYRKNGHFCKEKETHFLRIYSKRQIFRMLAKNGFASIRRENGYFQSKEYYHGVRNVWIAKKLASS